MNRAILSLIMIMSLTSQAFAQGSNSTKRPAPATYNYDPETLDRRPSPYMVDGFDIGFEYMAPNSSASDVMTKATGKTQKDVKNDLALVPKQMGFKAGYKQIRRGGFGFDLNLSILKASERPDGMSDMTTYMPSANLVLAAPEYVYAAAGLNTAVVDGDQNGKHDPRIGYQAGAGVIIKKNFNFEVFYSWINQRIEYAQTVAEEHATSTNARLIYTF